jgi:hypothetical protein
MAGLLVTPKSDAGGSFGKNFQKSHFFVSRKQNLFPEFV